MLRRLGLILIMVVPVLALSADTAGKRWWSYVEYLASDKLQGRLTGSEGHRLAARFVADRFKEDGLKPAGTQSYLQPMDFFSRTIDEKHTRLELIRDGKASPLVLGDDGILSAGIKPAASLEAPLVFAGYGLSVPEKKYDDLAGLDLHGKIAVYLVGGPATIPGALRAHHQSLAERWRALKDAGAVGTIAIPNPRHMDIPWERIKLLRSQPSMTLADPSLNETPGDKIAIYFNPASAEKLFTGSGHTFAEILELADQGKALPRFPLAVSLRAQATVHEQKVTSQNVAAVLPGSDSALRSQYIILSAHVDHLGMGQPIDGDNIYNGAMDNAAGVATILDVADSLHDGGTKLRRSVLFLIVTGEEKGLLGSKYFAAYPTVPRSELAGDLNVDMFLPIFPLRVLTVYGLDESDLGPMLKSVTAREDVAVQPDPAPERNVFIRSDQYSFIKIGVPSIFFGFGYTKGSPEEAKEKAWLTHRYHAPSDDLQQPVNLAAAAKYNRIVLELAEQMANRPTPPRWNDNSFFKRYAK